MSMLLVHELHEARDRILLLKQRLEKARERELPAYVPFLDEQILALDDALGKAKIPERYRVAVVGRFKVGKSAFVNKLAGQRLAGVDTNPETAAISVFRYDDQTYAEVELISKEEWERLSADHSEDPKNAEVKRYDRFLNFNDRPLRKDKEGKEIPRPPADLILLVEEWIKSGGKQHVIKAEKWETKEGQKHFLTAIRKFTSSQEPLHYLVNKLTIYAPIPILRDQIELIDTPGLDDTELFRVRLTEDIVKDVDAILFLTASGASYSQSDKEFIVRQLRRKQIKHLQLIITKCDETYENAVRDAHENDDKPPTYREFSAGESSRVKAETKATLNELLQSNQLKDEEGYYYIEQLDNVPVQLISTKYHDDGDMERGGVEAVKTDLYSILSTSYRFEQARSILVERLDTALNRLQQTYRERLSILEREFDPQKVKDEIESIREILSEKFGFFGERSGESLGLLSNDQEAFFLTFPVHLDVIGLLAKEVLSELEKTDLIKHWKTKRCGRWGYLTDLQAKIADRIFPKVEARLNDLRGHLESFMECMGRSLSKLQDEMRSLEAEHKLSGLEPIALASLQDPLFQGLRQTFESLGEQERDGIIAKLDDFVSEEVLERLNEARGMVSDVRGLGTTVRQAQQVSGFYGEIRSLLSQALREHLENRISEFSKAIRKHAESVGPRIREASEGLIQQRLNAIESTLKVAADCQKEMVSAYLREMVALFSNFAAEPCARVLPMSGLALPIDGIKDEESEPKSTVLGDGLCEQHYEITDGSAGYTYERIFRPYIDNAETIRIEDPYIRMQHQVDNLSRFCALAVRLGKVKNIQVISGSAYGENFDDADSRLETLRRDLIARGIDFSFSRNQKLHDREIRFDTGWTVKVGRGLDIYQKPENWISVEAADFALRKCRQTKVDVFRSL
jgi:hypothetical protein